jgi:hypothetical protein
MREILSQLAQVGLRARRLIEVLRNFLYKMVLSNNRATESQVEDYAAVYGARLAPALVKCLRTQSKRLFAY